MWPHVKSSAGGGAWGRVRRALPRLRRGLVHHGTELVVDGGFLAVW